MLTLTRKVGERIQIGDDIIIEVREIRRNQVRIGVVAPRDIPIQREELLEADEHKALMKRICEPEGLEEDSEPFEPPVIVRRGLGK